MNCVNETKKNEHKGKGQIVLFALLACLGNMFFGYFMLPFSSALYAIVLIFESKGRRLFSFLIPIITLVVNFALNGIYSPEGILYILPGVLIFLAYKKRSSKASLAFIMSFVFLISIAVSLVLYAISATNSASFSSVTEFYADAYVKLKDFIITKLTSIVEENETGFNFYAFNMHEAQVLFQTMTFALVPAFMVLSFALSGAALKLFSAMLYKQTKDSTIFEWRFEAPSIVAYFYIITAIISLFAPGSFSIFRLTLSAVNTLFMIVFAYVGARFLWAVIATKKNAGFAVVVFAIAFVVFSSFAISIFSYVGVYYTIIINRLNRANGK